MVRFIFNLLVALIRSNQLCGDKRLWIRPLATLAIAIGPPVVLQFYQISFSDTFYSAVFQSAAIIGGLFVGIALMAHDKYTKPQAKNMQLSQSDLSHLPESVRIGIIEENCSRRVAVGHYVFIRSIFVVMLSLLSIGALVIRETDVSAVQNTCSVVVESLTILMAISVLEILRALFYLLSSDFDSGAEEG